MNKKPSIEFYAKGAEKDRLSGHHLLEKDRTLRMLKKFLPPVPAIILDVGGAAGVYTFPLTEMGYEVHLIDPIPLHVKQAQEYAINCGRQLASYSVGDARKIEYNDHYADVVLFFGPLYHLTDPNDRLQALHEAYRVLKPGGLLLAAGISRFAYFMDGVFKATLYSKFEGIEQSLSTGILLPSSDDKFSGFLHHPDELREEVQKAGFENVSLRAIEGPVWGKQEIEILQQDPKSWDKLIELLETIETDETIIGASAHIMAVAKRT